MEQVEGELTHLHDKEMLLREKLGGHRDRARNEQERAERAKRIIRGEDQVKEHLEHAKRHETAAAGYDADLAKVRKEIAKLERQQESIREQMLTPKRRQQSFFRSFVSRPTGRLVAARLLIFGNLDL